MNKGFSLEMEKKIVLDHTSFMALASESRIDVLKKLDERQMTLSELAKELEKSKPAVLKHLTKLVDAGLVKKLDDERKWVYYALTFRGKNLLHPERVKITLLLSTALLSLAGALVLLYQYTRGKLVPLAEKVNLETRDIPPGNQTAQNETLYGSGDGFIGRITYDPELLHTGVILAIIAGVLIIAAIYIWRNRDRRTVLEKLQAPEP
jgi:DNA-binding transcriptional ArsR family regulator